MGFEVDFFVLLVKQLLGPLPSYTTSFLAKCPILFANKLVIVPLSIGAGRPVPKNEKTSNHNKGLCQLNPWVLPAVPSVSFVQSVPSVPAVQSVPVVPSVPSLPAVPSVPSVPSVPVVPSVPSVPVF